ncbi:hypothetical protein RDABS01_018776 [Bienertia sinuspersici]
MEDYNFVLTQGPWMIGDSYLTIRKWVPNFISNESPIRFLTSWIRIPNLSVEYFDRQFLHRIGGKIGRVIRIDRNTESRDWGQYVRFCMELDLFKPLLSMFRINGRVWRIQYEGLKLICFKCARLGHKDMDCHQFSQVHGEKEVQAVTNEHIGRVVEENKGQSREDGGKYGTRMMVQRKQRECQEGQWGLIMNKLIKQKDPGSDSVMMVENPIAQGVLTEEGGNMSLEILKPRDMAENRDISPGTRRIHNNWKSPNHSRGGSTSGAPTVHRSRDRGGNNEVSVTVLDSNSQHISVIIEKLGEEPWIFSVIYASPDSGIRRDIWRALKNVKNCFSGPWMLCGDFNDTTTLDERVGSYKAARLDHFLCNEEWRVKFDEASVKHLPK